MRKGLTQRDAGSPSPVLMSCTLGFSVVSMGHVCKQPLPHSYLQVFRIDSHPQPCALSLPGTGEPRAVPVFCWSLVLAEQAAGGQHQAANEMVQCKVQLWGLVLGHF